MNRYCMYLRKSRADIEAEAHGEGETLARHERALLETAKRLKLNVTKIYREVVSGETIAARPVMQQLLADIESEAWSGVLVMEVERLARGDTIDQGIIAQAFKCAGTKIITPLKTYDPDNEYDEEYFEFGLFMSRREYKTINRRLQGGRAASAKEGKFVGSIAPYGYERVKIPNDKGYTLKIVPENAEVVRLIFSMYTEGITDNNGERRRIGIQQIARRLNEMRIPPIRHDYWQKETIRDILINPTYAGKIRWGWRACKKRTGNGNLTTSRPRNDDFILVDGLHEPIVDEKTFQLAQEYISQAPPCPVGYKSSVKNPFAGIIICGKCGRRMVLRKGYNGKPDYIVCHARTCDNVSSPYRLVEERVLGALREWLDEYRLKWGEIEDKPSSEAAALYRSLKNIDADIGKLEKQLGRAHDLLEQGIYTTETFIDRSSVVSARIAESKDARLAVESEIGLIVAMEQGRKTIIPKVEQLLDAYASIDTASQKNNMLKEILEKAVYTKTVNGSVSGASASDFEIVLFPKLPGEV